MFSVRTERSWRLTAFTPESTKKQITFDKPGVYAFKGRADNEKGVASDQLVRSESRRQRSSDLRSDDILPALREYGRQTHHHRRLRVD